MSNKKRVLELLCEPFSFGGEEAFIMNLYNNINKSLYQIDILTPYYCDNNKNKEIIEKNNGHVYEMKLNFKPGTIRFNLIKNVNNFIRNNKYDIVHIHSGSISSLAICSFICKKNSIKKVIIHSHCAGEKQKFIRSLLKWFCNIIFGFYVDYFLACSQNAGQWMYSKKNIQKMRIINNGIEIDKYKYNEQIRKKIRKQLNIDEDVILIGNVGRLSYDKNQEYILDIIKKLTETYENYYAIFIGDGDEKENLLKKSKKLCIEKYVTFIGNVQNVNDYLQGMDIFLFPSRFEGLGMALIESQVSGINIITSNKIPKNVIINKNCYVLNIEQNNIDDWKKEIIKISKNKCNDRKSVSLILESEYDIKKTCKSIEEIYG